MNAANDNRYMVAGRFLRWHESRRKLAWIRARIDGGMTVYLQTVLRAVKIDARHVGMLEARRSGLYLNARGNAQCVSYCKLSAQ